MKRNQTEQNPIEDAENDESSKRKTRCRWSSQEDALLKDLAYIYEEKSWPCVADELAKKLINPLYPPKTAKQCRERWRNTIDPKILKHSWSATEKTIFFNLHEKIGDKWTEIAQNLPGRTDNGVKNFFYCKLRKIIRKVKRGYSEKTKSSEDLRFSLYCLNYLKNRYVIPISEQKENIEGDQYIVEIIRNYGITLEKIDLYYQCYLEKISIEETQNNTEKKTVKKVEPIPSPQSSIGKKL